MSRFLLLLSFLLVTTTLFAQTIRYVRPVATGSGDGSSWSNASSNLQAMIIASTTNDQVWVAGGVYKPTNGTDRTISFRMKNGVAIYGGFAGTETQLSQRNLNIATNTSFLSGDLNNNDVITGTGTSVNVLNNSENSFRVISNLFSSANPLTSSAVLDGFVITGGANEINTFSSFQSGAGMYNFEASPTLRNLVFRGNYGFGAGGGLANASNSSVVLTNVTFDRNWCSGLGGGMHNFTGCNATLNDVDFIGNMAYDQSFGGGGMASFENTTTLNRCRFVGNGASIGGAATFWKAQKVLNQCVFADNQSFRDAGGLYQVEGSLQIRSAIFYQNRAGLYGGALFNSGGSLSVSNATIVANRSGANISTNFPPYTLSSVLVTRANGTSSFQNSIIWGNNSLFEGNPGILRSVVQGGYAGFIVLDQDPEFVDAASPAGPDGLWATSDDGLRLKSCSPALNIGENTGIFGTDLIGNPRIFNSVVDAGAYELQAMPVPFVSLPAITSNNALKFDGVNDHVSLINSCNTSTPIVNGGDEITIEYWFKGSVLQSAVRLQPEAGTYVVSGHYGEHILSNDGGFMAGSGVPVGAAATDGNWHHVAMTWKRNTVNGFKSYLDGQLIAQRNSSNNPLPVVSSGAFLGAYNGTDQFLNGTLDDVRIWTVARSESEIQAGLCGNISLPQSGLIAWYSFDHGSPDFNNTSISAGLQNMAQSRYFDGQLNNFSLNGTSSNWVTGYLPSVTPAVSTPPTNRTSCVGGTTSFSVTATNATSYQWQIDTGMGYFNLTDNATYTGTNSATLEIIGVTPDLQGANYRCLVGGRCNLSTTSSAAQVTVAPANTLLVSSASATTQVNNISVSSAISSATCGLIATVQPSGVNPVSGGVFARLWIQGSTPIHAGKPYVRRHYELNPNTNAATATGTVTLYFTQAEFNDYNNTAGRGTDLPTGPSDAIGIANIRVMKYSGQSNDGSGTPASYPSTGITIIPDPANIVWNATQQYWAVTFDVDGFSGFTLTSKEPVVLALANVHLRGSITQQQGRLVWNLSEAHAGNQYELQHSSDGSRFRTIYTVIGDASTRQFSFVDAAMFSPVTYYRIKQTDVPGEVRFSNTIALSTARGAQSLLVHPNPVRRGSQIQPTLLAGETLLRWQLVSPLGQTLLQQQQALRGANFIQLPSSLAAGTYYLQIQTTAGTTGVKLMVE